METLLSRPDSSSSLNTHISRKKSPFMAFKDKITPSPPDRFPPPKSPLSSTPRYFDRYPKLPSSSPSPPPRSKARRATSPPISERTHDDDDDDEEEDEELGLERELERGRSYLFPSFDDMPTPGSDHGDELTPTHTRTRARSGGPSNKPLPHIPPLRYSGSSTFDSAPQTPIDAFAYHGQSIETVVVGVEAMDAMVDGMNGMDSDAYFGGGRSKMFRSRFAKIPHHHPLYQPPLPKPPPGIVLGGGKSRPDGSASGSSDEEELPTTPGPRSTNRRAAHPSSSQPTRMLDVTPPALASRASSEPIHSARHPNPDDPLRAARLEENRKSIVPSISEIIRSHALPAAQVRTRQIPGRSFMGRHPATLREETESEPEPLTADEEAQMMTRSSIDSIANEVQQTLRNQRTSKLAADLPPLLHTSPIREMTYIAEKPASPQSETGPTSLYASSAPSTHAPYSMYEPAQTDPSQDIAQYLRSTRLTTLLRLTRYPHATPQQPLTVSLSDLGSRTGFPVVCFLGLGCVRHVMGLYDEMAEILGLRLITIDRWGLGRTDTPRPKSARGIMEWASVVEEVLDMLNIEHCSVMAHSAGAPYALSFANRAPDRIRGDICLLAPWVGGSESGGYKWLKYVPNGILKTAQAAEWKVQAWMIGKPPTLAFKGIGYDASPSPASPRRDNRGNPRRRLSLARGKAAAESSVVYSESQPRPSLDSNFSSEYDDLRDFDGRFESRSTLGVNAPSIQSRMSSFGEPKRVPSKGFLRRLKSTTRSSSQPPPPDSPIGPASPRLSSNKKLKALRSMGSLRGKAASAPTTVAKRDVASTPQLPRSLGVEVGLGFEDLQWERTASVDGALSAPAMESRPISSDTTNSSSNTSETLEWARRIVTAPSTPPAMNSQHKFSEVASVSDKSSNVTSYSRSGTRRSLSFSIPRTTSPPTAPISPVTSMYTSPYANSLAPSFATPPSGGSYQATLGNALIAASHAESAKGTHSDFLQVLNHDNRPWGFQYSSYPHKVRVWYGDKDEKIAENAVRWMERNMGEEMCQVKVVKGADHALMYKSAVVIEVLERIREHARADACVSWIAPSML